jgi:hypothetical protein
MKSKCCNAEIIPMAIQLPEPKEFNPKGHPMKFINVCEKCNKEQHGS